MRGWEPLRLLWNGYCSPLKGGFCSGPGVLNIRQIKVFISLSQKGFLRSLEWLLVPGKILGRSPGFVTLLWLVVVRQQDGVTGICHQPSDFTQSGVHMLVLSLKLPSSTWRGGLGGALSLWRPGVLHCRDSEGGCGVGLSFCGRALSSLSDH